MNYPFVTAICCTYNRHFHLERVVRYFLDQDYKGDHLLLIYNNHPLSQELAPLKLSPNKRVIVINNSMDYYTRERYTNLGAIYRDALSHVPKTTHIITHMDDDDQYLPYHISEGVNGYQRSQLRSEAVYKAYKPLQSYYRDTEQKLHLVSNTMEPSIFVSADHLFEYGYKETTTDQHMGWYEPLASKGQIFIDAKGTPSFIYCWVGDVWKTSGSNAVNNFDNCRNYKGTVGDRLITPISSEEAQQHYLVQ